MSLSSGTRQKLGTSGEATSSRPSWRNDSRAPLARPTETLKASPFTVRASPDSSSSTGGIAARATAGAGPPAGRGSCSQATTCPDFAQTSSFAKE
jgi:hypothetical protein